jgi:hypothetical protein
MFSQLQDASTWLAFKCGNDYSTIMLAMLFMI